MSSTSEDNDGRAEQDPVITFQPRFLPDESTPPNPTNAEDHYRYSQQTSEERSGELLVGVTNAELPIEDAAKAGWVMYYPTALEADEGGESSPELRPVGADATDTEIVQQSELRDDVYIIDTKWNVRIPPGTVLRAYPMFNHAPGKTVTAIPSIVARAQPASDSESEREFVPVRIRVQVNDSGPISPRDPCVQLLLTDDVAPAVPYETLSEDELVEVEKQARAMRIYPDWYARHNASDER